MPLRYHRAKDTWPRKPSSAERRASFPWVLSAGSRLCSLASYRSSILGFRISSLRIIICTWLPLAPSGWILLTLRPYAMQALKRGQLRRSGWKGWKRMISIIEQLGDHCVFEVKGSEVFQKQEWTTSSCYCCSKVRQKATENVSLYVALRKSAVTFERAVSVKHWSWKSHCNVNDEWNMWKLGQLE